MNFFKVGHAPVLSLGDRRNGHQPAQHDVGEALGPFGGGADLGDGKAALGLLPADVDLKENGLDDAELFGLPVDILKQLIGADGFGFAPTPDGYEKMPQIGNVEIGDNNVLMNSVSVLYGARIGNGNVIFPGAVISAVPQDLKFQGEDTTAEVGDNNKIRENVTINRGTAAKGRTIVGSNNLLMEGVHVAHDALIGNGCIIGNSTKMAGEIVIDDNAIISANVLMHQFCRVGGYGMIQGGCRFSKDIPPYIIAGREPIAYSGINIIGLRRRGFSNETIENIHNAYRIIYQSGLNTSDALKKIEEEIPTSPEIEYIVSFIRDSERGIIR